MRLLALDCKQVGHWDSPLQLALSSRITVVLGDNEAGKSTLRRALRALLFGPDKALAAPLLVGGFEMSAQLDMGATGACTLHRKGRNLQEPLPEAAVALLDSANAGRFAGLFDLTHENLSPQDQAFLKAEGALGSMMFGARTGVSPARLQQAREYIDKALSKVESGKKDNDGLPHCQKQLQEAKRRHDALARFGEIDTLHDRHEDLIRQVERLDSQLVQLDKESRWLQGLIDGAPEVQHLARARQALDVLVAQGLPPPVAKVVEFDQRLSRVEEQAQTLLDKRAALEESLAKLAAAEAPGELHALAAQCDALRDVVATHTADGGVQETARQRQARKRAELEQLLARMGVPIGGDPVATARALLLPEPMTVQLRTLVFRHDELHRELRQKNELLSAAQRRLQGMEVEDVDPAATAVDALEAALPYLQSAVAAEQELVRLDATRADAMQKLRDQQAALRLASDVGNVDALQPPTAESAGQAEQKLAAALQQWKVANTQSQRRNGELTRLHQQLAERRVQIGSVASAEDVVQARALRDARLEALCASLEADGKLPGPTLVAQAGELRTLVRQSDLLVDRRMEAGEALGQLRADEQRAEELARQCEEDQGEVAVTEAAVAKARQGVSALWPFLSEAPASSAAWLAQFQAWRLSAQELQQCEQEIAGHRNALNVARTDALALLAGSLPQLEGLGSAQALLDAVLRERDVRRLRAGRMEALQKQRHEAGLCCAAAQDAVTAVTHALNDWQAQWDAATRDLPSGLARAPAAIDSWLALQDALRTALGELDSLAKDIETRAAMLGDKRRRIDDLVQAAQAMTPDFRLPQGLDPAAAFARVEEACKASASRLAYQKSLERDHLKAARDVEAALVAHDTAHAGLQEEWAAAGIAEACSRDMLAVIAGRARENERLNGEIARAEASLKGRWGSQMPVAISELEASGVAVLEARRSDILTALESTRRERDTAADARRDAGQALEAMRQGHDAAAAAQALADAREALFDKVEERFRLQVAKLILDRAQRDASDGGLSLQEAASGYFRTLTGGAYSGLRISDEGVGTPELVAVESGRREKSLAELSAGTRDQIWLALRLAGIVAAARETPFPLLLDDSLVQFDDTRATAALKLLHEISTHVQVIVFTHHDRLMDLAEAALPASDLALVVLPAVDGRMRERSASKRPAGPRERPRLQPGEMATGGASWDDVEASDTGPRQGQAGARSSRRETRTSAVEEAKQVILEILEVASEPLGKSDVLGRASHTGRPIDSAWNEAINNLLSARRVAKAGEKRGTRYWLSHPPAGQSGEHSA